MADNPPVNPCAGQETLFGCYKGQPVPFPAPPVGTPVVTVITFNDDGTATGDWQNAAGTTIAGRMLTRIGNWLSSRLR